MRLKHLILAAASVGAATPALAHTGVHSMSGFAAGFLHPLGGFDHMIAMLGVGLFAASLGSRALIVVPASFVLMMIVGGVIGLAGINLPAVEVSIAASVVAVGAVVALGRSWPLSAAAMLVGFFALFHGYAHGTEVPSGATAFSYSVGFSLASAALHALGIGLSRIAMGHEKANQFLGAAITLAGFVIAFG
ncbi:HupE/UreJ family protein [Microvirga sp. BT688]|uniref:HupE/UreJ family protein n=1 Tax=Microvirga sp. TaxID=1873136 RepID=UPI001681F3ED|nr:HupE/UreJ family protein [Microvirga sp.]MBD2749491.1 HupE/UreJ family protein [Microvirga sp.]